jgi:hypothetical protein
MLEEHGRQDRRAVPRLEVLHGVAVGRPAPASGREVAAN